MTIFQRELSDFPPAGPLDGTEVVVVDQGRVPFTTTVRTTTRQIADLIAGSIPGTDKTFSFAGTVFASIGTSRWYATATSNISYVLASVNTPSGGQPIIVDVRKNGVTIFSDPANRPTIAPGMNLSIAIPDVIALTRQSDYLQVDVIQAGSDPDAGSDLDVQIAFA